MRGTDSKERKSERDKTVKISGGNPPVAIIGGMAVNHGAPGRTSSSRRSAGVGTPDPRSIH